MHQTMLPSRDHRSAANQSEGQSFDPWLVWVTFRRSWHWAIPVGLVIGCIASFGVLKSFVPRFNAQYLLRANPNFLLNKGMMPTVRDLARTENAIIFSHVVLDPVLSDAETRTAPSLNNPDTAEQNLRRNLTVRSAGSGSQMFIGYEDSDKHAAAMVCNAVVESYLRYRSEADQERINSLEKLLLPEIDKWKREVETKEERYQKLSAENLGYFPASEAEKREHDSRLTRLDALRSQVADLEIEIVLMEERQKAFLESAPEWSDVPAVPDPEFVEPPSMAVKRVVDAASVQAVVNEAPAVKEAAANIAHYKRLAQQMEDSDLVRLYREKYQEHLASVASWEKTLADESEKASGTARQELERRAEEDYQNALKAEKEENKRLRAKFIADLESRRRERQQQFALEQSQAELDLASAIDSKRRELDLLRIQYDDEKARQEQFVGNSANLQFAQADLERATEFLDRLQDRITGIKLEGRQYNAVLSVAPAMPPSTPVEALPYKKLVLAGGAGFMVPFLLGLLWEIRTNRVVDSLAIDKSQGLAPVVGELARSPSTGSGRGSRGRRVFQESVDTFRANLFLSQETRDSRSLAIVSSMSGEGKSTTASQLAISLAKASGKTVLIIDADMRCPDQHDVFGLPLEPGLSGVLAGDATLGDAVQTELGDLIHVLPAGRLKASPHRLMTPDTMKQLVDEALKRYEFVIFDTAPVLSAGETLAVASAVDATLVCAMRDVTRMDSVVRTTHRLESAGANVAGTVFNGVTPRQYAYRYGDYNYSNVGEFIGQNN